METHATVGELLTYPVKGCAPVPLTGAGLTPAGLPYDRAFMVVGEGGGYRSQRRDPTLALIRPEVGDGGSELTLRTAGVDPVRITVDLVSERTPVELFGVPYTGIDQGEEAARWLTEVLGAPSRLVRVPPEHHRVEAGIHPSTSAYADSCALHVLSRATFDDLNSRYTAAGKPSLPMSRFRPNIVVDGWDEPHQEDHARRVLVGDAELGFAKPAIRCAVTLVDQEAGVKAGPEPLRMLASYRRVPEGGVAFGALYSVLRPGKLAVGDAFTVVEGTLPGGPTSSVM
ncbi:MOSC N-terminal beta barrel domain-containing protein [Streptomyces sp. NPDC048483]|uniref:MOSC domain-containing protein n=1 Tax=Streptomyces sp. NPDC048483 TaxID=3154927 RepID=UPI00342B730F